MPDRHRCVRASGGFLLGGSGARRGRESAFALEATDYQGFVTIAFGGIRNPAPFEGSDMER
jgi:hypothetical protein